MQKKLREITSRNLNATNGLFLFLGSGGNWLCNSKEQSQQRLLVNRERCLIVYINGKETVEHLCCIITESDVRAAVVAVMDSIKWLLLDKLHENLVVEM